MTDTSTLVAPPATSIDVRLITPRDRHSTIFGILSVLPVGQALLLINDHDPKPLHYQLQADAADAFSWDYVENGPQRWQVRIGKLVATSVVSTGGCCGGH